MKKISLLILFFSLQIFAMGQDFDPTTKWPYLYKDFQNGTIYFEGNKKMIVKANVHLLNSVLHYLKGDVVYQVDAKGIVKVELGDDQFIYVKDILMKVVKESKNNILASVVKGDFGAIKNTSGAYGTSSQTASTKDLSSIDIGGLNNTDYHQLVVEKEDGQLLSVKKEYFFILQSQVIPATKKGVEKYVGSAKENDLQTYLKQHKIKWKNEESLELLLDFFN